MAYNSSKTISYIYFLKKKGIKIENLGYVKGKP